MVYFMENPIKMDDLGGIIIFGNTHNYKLSIAVPLIDIYTSRRRVSLFCVLPLAVGKSGWNSPPKLFCVFLALGAVRTFLYAGRQVDEAG